MSCFNPRRIWILGKDKNGKIKTRLTDVETTACKNLLGFRFLDINTESYIIPCGQCIGCRMDYSKFRANRCYLESLEYDKDCNWFITLTYRDEKLPVGHTLQKKDWQLFMKRFRKNFNSAYYKYCLENNLKFEYKNIRFLACGEYGDTTFRPHYHAIIFNCPFFDLSKEFEWYDEKEKIVKKRLLMSKTKPMFFSKILYDSWGLGNITIASANWNTMAYVSRYIVKKQKGKDNIYEKLGIEKPFLLASRRPGIGYNFFYNNLDLISNVDEIYIPQGLKGDVSISKPGRYFDKILEKEHPKILESLKFVRKYLAEHQPEKNNSNSYRENLKADERELQNKLRIFKRGIE